MSGEFYVLPLCDHEIAVSEFTSDWVQCRCGIYYRESSLIAFKDALQQLSAASNRLDHIEAAAVNLNLQRASELGYQDASPAASAQVPVAAASASSAATTTVAAPEIPKFTPPPVAKPTRPKRELPKLSPQQTLLAVAGALIVIALTIFLGTSFAYLGTAGQGAVIAALVAASASGSIKAKKYFTIISNFLAMLSSLFLGAGLWAASSLGLLPQAWADPTQSPYVPVVILAVGAYSFFMGKRFGIFGFSALVAPAAATASLIFSSTYLAGMLASSSPLRSLSAIAMLSVSLGMFATIIIGRQTLATRLAAAAVAKGESKSKSKKTPEDESAEASYQKDLAEREINALTVIYRASVVGLLAYLAVQTLGLFAPLVQSAFWQTLPIEITPEPISVLSLGLLWLLAALFIERSGAKFTAAGTVKTSVKRLAWNAGFSYTAISLAVLTSTLQPGVGGVIQETSIFMLILNALIGAAFLFSVPKRVAEDMPNSVIASQVAAYVNWVLFGLLTPVDVNFNLYASIWLGVIAASLVAKSLVAKAQALAWVGLGVGSASTLLLISNPRIDTSADAGLSVFALIVLALALAFAWRVVVEKSLKRIEGTGVSAVGWIYFGVNVLVTVASVALWVRHFSDAGQTNNLASWPVLSLFAVLSAAFAWLATAKSSRLVELPSPSLVGVSATFALAGYGLMLSSPVDGTQNLPWAIYSLAVFGSVVLFALRAKSDAAKSVALAPALLATNFFALQLVDLSEPMALISPLYFFALAALFTIVLKRFTKPQGTAFTISALVLFVLTFAEYWVTKLDKTQAWMLDSDGLLNNAAWATLVFVVIAAVSLLTYLKSGFTEDKFWSIYLRVTGVFTLVAALQVAASVTETMVSVWLTTAVLFVAVVLTGLVGSQLRSRIWLAALLASALTFVLSLQAAAIGEFAPATGGIFEAWVSLLVPVSLAVAWLVYSIVVTFSSKREVTFGWFGLPVATVVAALLAYLTAPLLSLYRSDALPSIDSTNPWPLVFGFVGLAVAYGLIRLRVRENADAGLSLLASSFVALALSIIGLAAYDRTAPGFEFALAALLAANALMHFAASFIAKEAKTALYGFILGVGASWVALAELVQQFNLSFVQSFAFASTLLFVVTTILFKRSNEKPSMETWSLALPVTSAIGYFVALLFIDVYSLVDQPTFWIELIVSALVGSAYLMLSRTKVLGETRQAKAALIVSAAISWVFAVWQSTLDSSTRDIRFGIVTAVIGVTLLAYTLLERKLVTVLVGALALALSAYSFAEVLVRQIGGYDAPEIHATLIAITLAISVQVANRAGLVAERLKSLLSLGLPLLAVGLPSTVYNWGAVVQNFSEQSSTDITRTLVLMIGGAVLLTLGLRFGNLGLTVAGSVPLALTLLPSIWFRIGEYFEGKVETEMKALFIGGLLFGIGYGLVAAFKLKLNSSLYIGLPILVAMSPALANTFGALNQATLTAEDWYRFAIVLGGSLVFLILGALRRLAGFFAPGAIGVLIAAVPYAWKPLSEQTWSVWVVLIIVAGLLVWMAIKLEQFKKNAKSTSVWLKELR
jgi:hypothetical protein